MKCYCGGESKFVESKSSKGYWHVFCTGCKHHHEDYGKDKVAALWYDAVNNAETRKLSLANWKTGWSIMWDR